MDDQIYANMDDSDDNDGWDQDEFDDDDDDYIIQEEPNEQMPPLPGEVANQGQMNRPPPRPGRKPLPKPKVLPKHDINSGGRRLPGNQQPPYNRDFQSSHSPHSNVANANAQVLPKHDINSGGGRFGMEYVEQPGNQQPPNNRDFQSSHSPHSNVANANVVSNIKQGPNQSIRKSYPSNPFNATSRNILNSDDENYEVQEFGNNKDNIEPMSGENFRNKLSFLQSKFTQNTTLSNDSDDLYEVNEGTKNVNSTTVNRPMESNTVHPTNPPKLGKTIIPNRQDQDTDMLYPGPHSKYASEHRLNARNIQENIRVQTTVSGERGEQKHKMPKPSIPPNRQRQITDMPYPSPHSKYASEHRLNARNIQDNLKVQTPVSEERTDQIHARPFINKCNSYQSNNKEQQLSVSDTPFEEENYEVPGQGLVSNTPRNVSNIRPGIPYEFNSSSTNKPLQNTPNRQGNNTNAPFSGQRNIPGIEAKPSSFQSNKKCLNNSIEPTEDYELMDPIPPKNVSTKDFQYNYISPESPMVYPSVNKPQHHSMPLQTEELYEAVDNDHVRPQGNPGIVGLARTANLPPRADNLPPRADNPRADNFPPRADNFPPRADNLPPRTDNIPPRGSFSNSSSNQSSPFMNSLNVTHPAKPMIPPAKPMKPTIPNKSPNRDSPNFIREIQQTQAQKTNRGSPTAVGKMQMTPALMSEHNINGNSGNFLAEMQVAQGHGGLTKWSAPPSIPAKLDNIPTAKINPPARVTSALQEPAENRNMQKQLSEERMFPIKDLIPNKNVAPAETNKPLPRMGSVNAPSVNTRPKSEGNEYYAVRDFSGEHGCLTFSRGDTISVTQTSGSWWYGSLNGKVGRFPADYVKKDKNAPEDLFRNSWYGANMDRKVAENKLKMKSQDGGFIIRDSSKGGGYCISIYHSGSFTHLRMPLKDDYYYLGDSGTQKFSTISELVTYYSAHIINLKTGAETMLVP